MQQRWQPTWPIAVMALVQIMVAFPFLSTVEHLGGFSDAGQIVGEVLFAGVGLAVTGFAVRNFVRLWQVRAWEATWTLVGALVVAAGLLLLEGVAELVTGYWDAMTFLVLAYGSYFLIMAFREVVRRGRLPLRRYPVAERTAPAAGQPSGGTTS